MCDNTLLQFLCGSSDPTKIAETARFLNLVTIKNARNLMKCGYMPYYDFLEILNCEGALPTSTQLDMWTLSNRVKRPRAFKQMLCLEKIRAMYFLPDADTKTLYGIEEEICLMDSSVLEADDGAAAAAGNSFLSYAFPANMFGVPATSTSSSSTPASSHYTPMSSTSATFSGGLSQALKMPPVPTKPSVLTEPPSPIDGIVAKFTEMLSAASVANVPQMIARWTSYTTTLLSHLVSGFVDSCSPATRTLQIVSTVSTLTAMIMEIWGGNSPPSESEIKTELWNLLPTWLTENIVDHQDEENRAEYLERIGLMMRDGNSMPEPSEPEVHIQNKTRSVYSKKVFTAPDQYKLPSGPKSCIQATPDAYILVKKCLGLVVCAAVCASTGGDVKDMNYIITLGKLKDALKSMVKDGEELADFVVNDILELKWGTSDEAADGVYAVIKEIDRMLLMNDPHFGEVPNDFYLLQKLWLQASEQQRILRNASDPKLKNLMHTLGSKSLILYQKIQSVRVFVEANNNRQEPVLLMVKGPAGHGKTTWVNNWLIPQIAKRAGLSPAVYHVKMSPEEKYFPEYANQAFMVLDEFLNTGNKDPSICKLNSLASSGYYNMEGAFIKCQPCHLLFIICLTNLVKHMLISPPLTDEAAFAFWTRFKVLEFIMKNYNVLFNRYCQTRSATYDNIQLTWQNWKFPTVPVPTPAQANTATPPPAPAITVLNSHWVLDPSSDVVLGSMLEILDWASAELNMKSMTHIQNLAAVQAVMGGVTQGQTGHYIFHVHGQTGVGKSYFCRQVTNNLAAVLKLPVVEMSNKVTVPTPLVRSIFLLHDILENETDYLHLYNTAPYGSLFVLTSNTDFKNNLIFYQHNTVVCNEVGLPRRLGLTGNIKVQGQWIKIPEYEGNYVAMKSRGFVGWGTETFGMLKTSENVYHRYINYLNKTNDPKPIVGTVPADASICVYFKDWPLCREMLSNPISMTMCYLKPNANASVVVKTDEVGDLMTLDTSAFILPTNLNLATADHTDIVMSLASRLKSSGYASDVRIDVGGDQFYLNDKLLITNEQLHQLTWTESTDTLNFTYGEMKDSFSKDTVFLGLKEGFRTIPYAWAKILTDNIQLVSNSPALAVSKAKFEATKLKQQKAQYVMDNKESTWALFKLHPMYPVAMAIGGVACLAAVATCIYSMMRPTIVPEIKLTYEEATKRFGNAPKPTAIIQGTKDDDEVPSRDYDKFSEESDKRNLTKSQKSKLWATRLAYDRPVYLPIGDTEYEYLMQDEHALPEAIFNLHIKPTSHGSFLKMVETAMVRVVADLELFGICIKDNLIITCAHAITTDRRTATILADGKDGKIVAYTAEILALDRQLDLCLLSVVTKTWPKARDITNHFMDTSAADHVTYGYAMLISDGRSKLNTCMFTPWMAPVDGGIQHSAWSADFTQTAVCPTFEGSCGSPYIAIDVRTKQPKIVGIHAAKTILYTRGILATLPIEKLLMFIGGQAINEAAVPMETGDNIQLAFKIGQDNVVGLLPQDWTTLMKSDRPKEMPYYPNVTPLYTATFDPALPRKHKYSRTPFAHVVNSKYDTVRNSPLTPKECNAPEKLAHNTRGEPSILLTQIQKFNSPTPHMHEKSFDRAQNRMLDTMQKSYSVDKGLATWHQTFNGLGPENPLYGYGEGMELDTSPGVYWKKKHQLVTKRQLFQGEHPNLTIANTMAGLEFKNNLHDAWEMAIVGDRPIFLNSDKIKAELSPKDGRLFSVADIVEVCVGRKALLIPMAAIKKSRGTGPFQIGLNPVEEFWQLYQRMRSYGENGISIDVSACDKTIPQVLGKNAMRILAQVFGLPKALCKVLWQMICFGVHWASRTVYGRNCGQNSGGYPTVVYNCFCVYLALSYAFEFAWFKKFGVPAPHGIDFYLCIVMMADDITFAMKKEVEWFDMRVINLIFAMFGMSVKEAGPGLGKPTPIKELIFLSRKFRQENADEILVFPAAKPAVYMRHFFWSSTQSDKQYASNFNVVLWEAMMHGPDHFNFCLSRVLECIVFLQSPKLVMDMDLRSYKYRKPMLVEAIINKTGITCCPIGMQALSLPDRFTIKDLQRFVSGSEVLENPITSIKLDLIDTVVQGKKPQIVPNLEKVSTILTENKTTQPTMNNEPKTFIDAKYETFVSNVLHKTMQFYPLKTDDELSFIPRDIREFYNDLERFHKHLHVSWSVNRHFRAVARVFNTFDCTTTTYAYLHEHSWKDSHSHVKSDKKILIWFFRECKAGCAKRTQIPIYDEEMDFGNESLPSIPAVKPLHMAEDVVGKIPNDLTHYPKPATILTQLLAQAVEKQSGRGRGARRNTSLADDNSQRDVRKPSGVGSSINPPAALILAGSTVATATAETSSLPATATVMNNPTAAGSQTICMLDTFPPEFMRFAGTLNNALTSCFDVYTRLRSVDLTNDASTGQIVLTLAHDPLALGAQHRWLANPHKFWDGKIQYKVQVVINKAIKGTVIMVQVNDVNNPPSMEEAMMATQNWVSLDLSESTTAEFVTQDVRTKDLLRTVQYTEGVSEPIPGYVMYVDVPMYNPYGAENATATFITYGRFDMSTIFTVPSLTISSSLSPNSGSYVTALEGRSLAELLPPSSVESALRLYIDGFAQGSAVSSPGYMGTTFNYQTVPMTVTVVPSVAQPKNYSFLGDTVGNLFWAGNGSWSGSVGNMFGGTAIPSSFPGNVWTVTSGKLNSTAIADGWLVGMSNESGGLNWGTEIDITDIGVTETPISVQMPAPGSDYGVGALKYPASFDVSALPNTWVNMLITRTSQQTMLSTQETPLAGRPLQMYSLSATRFHEFLKRIADGRILQFYIQSPYTSSPVVTCRFDPALGSLMCDFGSRLLNYAVYNGGLLDDYKITNVRFVSAAQALPTSQASNFVTLVQTVQTTRTARQPIVKQAMMAAMMGASMVEGLGKGASSYFGTKRQYQHDVDMSNLNYSHASSLQRQGAVQKLGTNAFMSVLNYQLQYKQAVRMAGLNAPSTYITDPYDPNDTTVAIPAETMSPRDIEEADFDWIDPEEDDEDNEWFSGQIEPSYDDVDTSSISPSTGSDQTYYSTASVQPSQSTKTPDYAPQPWTSMDGVPSQTPSSTSIPSKASGPEQVKNPGFKRNPMTSALPSETWKAAV